MERQPLTPIFQGRADAKFKVENKIIRLPYEARAMLDLSRVSAKLKRDVRVPEES